MSLDTAASDLKARLVQSYTGNAHVYEALPCAPTEALPIDSRSLDMLHRFAKNNPIYETHTEYTIDGIQCTIYEGDITGHWLDSTKHDTSGAPFYPTWILSAHILALKAIDLGAKSAIDVGSGDGRIAYCCEVMGITSHGIEIDSGLADLQIKIAQDTGVPFKAICADAVNLDYTPLNLKYPVFFIGALPGQGDSLAQGIISASPKDALFVFTGARPRQKGTIYGWQDLLSKNSLEVKEILELPTRWTLDQKSNTPYIFAVRK